MPGTTETPGNRAVAGETPVAEANAKGQSGGDPEPAGDPVEAALADALTKASAAGQWDVVARIAAELQARREARARVVQLDVERSKRGGTR